MDESVKLELELVFSESVTSPSEIKEVMENVLDALEHWIQNSLTGISPMNCGFTTRIYLTGPDNQQMSRIYD